MRGVNAKAGSKDPLSVDNEADVSFTAHLWRARIASLASSRTLEGSTDPALASAPGDQSDSDSSRGHGILLGALRRSETFRRSKKRSGAMRNVPPVSNAFLDCQMRCEALKNARKLLETLRSRKKRSESLRSVLRLSETFGKSKKSSESLRSVRKLEKTFRETSETFRGSNNPAQTPKCSAILRPTSRKFRPLSPRPRTRENH